MLRLLVPAALLLLAACDGMSAEKPDEGDTGSGDTDSGEPDSGDTDSGGADSGDSDPDSGETDSGDSDPGPDTGPIVLSSDDAVATGDCGEVETICASGGCTLAADLRTVTLAGTVPVAGEGWALRLTDTRVSIGTGNPLDGSSWARTTPFGSQALPADGAYGARIVAGTYDVSLDYDADGSSVERHFPVARDVAFDAGGTYDATLDLHGVSGAITLDGAAVTDPGWLRFEEPSTGGYAWEYVRDGAYVATLPDGAWDVTFTPDDPEVLAEGPYAVGTVVVAGADVTEDLPIDAARVSGTLLLGGAPPDWGSTWAIDFVDEDGARWEAPFVGGQSDWETWLPAGTYAALVESLVVGDGLVVEEGAAFDLADGLLPIVTGAFAVEGAAPDGIWTLQLEDMTTGARATIDSASWSRGVRAGVYDVYARRSSWAEAEVRARIATGVAVAAGDHLVYDLDLAELSGTVTWSGIAPAAGDWWVVLVDDAGETSFFTPSGDAWRATVPVGTYDLYVRTRHTHVDRHFALARGLVVTGDATYTLAVTAHALEGAVTLDGAAPAGFSLYAHDVVTGDTLSGSVRDPGAWDVALPAGVYTFLAALPELDGVDHAVPVATCVRIGG